MSSSILFFLAGLLWNAYTVRRIDSLFQLSTQTVFLITVSVLVTVKLRKKYKGSEVPLQLKTPWYYHNRLIPFLFGALLGTDALLFYKSASLLPSIIFVLFLFLLIVINEFYKKERYQSFLWMFQLIIAHAAYWMIIIPITVKKMGLHPFLAALACSVIGLYFILITSRAPLRYFILTLAMHLSFLGLYQLQWIPPIPLSIRYAGIYHDITKQEGYYWLKSETPFWKFWKKGDQDFLSRPGDTLHVFVQIFAPTGFNDQLFIVWQKQSDAKQWVTQDKIPLLITGGREHGFRGHSNKSNYTEGYWRVLIKTLDDREVGRLTFTITPDARWTERVWHIDRR